jgi:hypothetical protein
MKYRIKRNILRENRKKGICIMKKLQSVVLLTILTPIVILFSCAGSPAAEDQIKTENEMRGYERMKSDFRLTDKDDLEKAGIYYDGRLFHIVISLSDSGTDRYPEWACDKFLNSLYAYNAVVQGMVSDNEFYEFALKFTIDEIAEGKYENITRVTVKERDVKRFLESYKTEE